MIIVLKLCAILAFVILLVFVLVRTFKGKVVAQFQAQTGKHNFQIHNAGYYSIWVNAYAYRGVPMNVFQPKIQQQADGKIIKTLTSYLKPNIANETGESSMQLKYCYLPVGIYDLVISASTLAEPEETILLKAIANMKDAAYGFQIKKTFPEFLFPLILILGIVPVFMIMASLRP